MSGGCDRQEATFTDYPVTKVPSLDAIDTASGPAEGETSESGA